MKKASTIFTRERLYSFWPFVLALFLYGLLFIARLETFNSFINKIVGPVFSAVIVLFFMRQLKEFPPEIYIYTFFVIWGLTGLFVVVDSDVYWLMYTRAVQVFILMVLVTLVMLTYGDPRLPLIAMALTSLSFLAYSYFGGDITTLEIDSQKDRIGGLIGNANGFGYIMLLGVVSAFYFWQEHRSIIVRFVILVLISIFGVGILVSASRKTFLGFVLFFVFWFVFCMRKTLLNNWKFVLASLVLLIFAYQGVYYVLEHTYLGSRFFEFQNMQDIKGDNRYELYKEGFAMANKNPFFGVGIGNYGYHAYELTYAHSDWMEILSTMGYVGLSIYIIFYAAIFLRMRKIIRLTNDPKIVYYINFWRAFLLAHLIIAFGRPNFNDLFAMTTIGFIIGYIRHVEMIKLGRFVLKSPIPQVPIQGAGSPIPATSKVYSQ